MVNFTVLMNSFGYEFFKKYFILIIFHVSGEIFLLILNNIFAHLNVHTYVQVATEDIGNHQLET
jgi:hypothetical protein